MLQGVKGIVLVAAEIELLLQQHFKPFLPLVHSFLGVIDEESTALNAVQQLKLRKRRKRSRKL